MKITICKLPLEIIPYQEVELPTGVSLLSVGMEQGSGLTLWFESYDDGAKGVRPKRRVQVFVLPTGYSGDEIIGASYVGTVHDFSGAAWHVYALGAVVQR